MLKNKAKITMKLVVEHNIYTYSHGGAMQISDVL